MTVEALRDILDQCPDKAVVLLRQEYDGQLIELTFASDRLATAVTRTNCVNAGEQYWTDLPPKTVMDHDPNGLPVALPVVVLGEDPR